MKGGRQRGERGRKMIEEEGRRKRNREREKRRRGGEGGEMAEYRAMGGVRKGREG